jgi:hypothetical protein
MHRFVDVEETPHVACVTVSGNASHPRGHRRHCNRPITKATARNLRASQVERSANWPQFASGRSRLRGVQMYPARRTDCPQDVILDQATVTSPERVYFRPCPRLAGEGSRMCRAVSTARMSAATAIKSPAAQPSAASSPRGNVSLTKSDGEQSGHFQKARSMKA